MINKSIFTEDVLLDEQFSDPWIMMSDLCRKAWKKRLRSFASYYDSLECSPLIIYGSTERREKQRKDSEALYLSKWGEPLSAIIYLNNVDTISEYLMLGARHGDKYMLLIPHNSYPSFLSEATNLNHLSIDCHKLPRFFAGRTINTLIKKYSGSYPLFVTDESTDKLDLSSMRIAAKDEFIESVLMCERKYYGD